MVPKHWAIASGAAGFGLGLLIGILDWKGIEMPNWAFGLLLSVSGISILLGVVFGFLAMKLTFIFQLPIRRLRPVVSPTGGTPGIIFFDHRPEMQFLISKVRASRSVWAAYIVGGTASDTSLLSHGHFERLILAHPDSHVLDLLSKLQPSHSHSELSQRILTLTGHARNRKIPVKWCRDMAYSLLNVGNPPADPRDPIPDDTWVFIEAWVPGIDAQKRPSLYTTAQSYPAFCRNMIQAFDSLWEFAQEPDSSYEPLIGQTLRPEKAQ